jgi:hypothetical protein
MTPESRVIEALFHVIDKESQEDVPFKLNSAQRSVDSAWTPRMLIPKARQRGISTYFLARGAVRCMGRKNTSAVVISHEAEATERMFGRVKYFLDTMEGPKPVIRNNSKHELTFPKTNSVFWIGTAGSRKFGRGDTVTDLHCSEVAYWPDAPSLMAGLLQAVPKRGGVISVESTGNGMGNWYHNACMRAAKGLSSFGLVFLPWQDEEQYQLELSDEVARAYMENLREDIEEPELVSGHGLSAAQLAWRRMVLEDELEGDLRLFKQEYPTVLDDCFQSAGGGIFQSVQFVETPLWERSDQHMHVLRGHPQAGHMYVLGGDVGGGVGADSSVMEIFDLNLGEQVGEWLSNKIDPDIFGEKICQVAQRFNEAYICVESNNHGILTLATIRNKEYPAGKVYRTPRANTGRGKDDVKKVVDLGHRTTATSRPFVIGLLRKALRDEWIIHSQILKAELSSFIETAAGDLEAATGCHDDTVIAAAMARYVSTKAVLALTDAPVRDIVEDASPHSFEDIIEGVLNAQPGLPFPNANPDEYTPLLNDKVR